MSNIQNSPKVIGLEVVDVRRAAIEHRALWLAQIYLEAKEDGLDLEPIMRRAIFKCGHRGGAREKAEIGTGNIKANEYGRYFLNHSIPQTFEKSLVKDTADEYILDFHYCPLVAAWQKLGLDDKACDLLCDIVMEADRGTAQAVGLDFTLEKTIAKGDEVCRLRYNTKK